LNPAGYHLLSISLHMLCSVLVLVLIRRWSGDPLTALLAALLFAALPVHTENVCWISGYPDLEGTSFILLAVLLYTSRFGQKSEWRPLRLIGLALCSFLGLLSKEIAIVIPAICLAWELFERRDIASIARDRWSDYVAMACGIAPYLALRIHALGGLAPYVTGQPLPLSAQLFTRITLFHRYLVKILWPVDLSAFEDFPPSRTLWDWRVVAGLGELVVFVWLLVWLWRKREPATLGLVIFAVALAPAFTLPYAGFNLLAERYLYLPSLGFCWLVAWRLTEMRKSFGGGKVALLMAGLLLAYGARTEARNLDWRSEIPFYKKTVAMAPSVPELHVLLGEAYLRREMLPPALQETLLAAAMKPHSAEAANNLGQIYSIMNQPEKAAAAYRQAIEDSQQQIAGPGVARIYNNLAYEMNRLGKTGDAILLYRKALQINPEFAAAYNNLGYLFLERGRYEEAEEALHQSMLLDPTFPQPVSNLGLLYVRIGKLDLAERHLNEALRVEPRSGETVARLGELALARGDLARAAALFKQAQVLDPGNKRAAGGLAALR
jgi:Flp pilus assembly protein TadD